MDKRPFFTRSPRLAFLRDLMASCAELDWERTDLATIFRAVDQRCDELFPTENRGEWFSPVFLGGVGINHIPPHLIFAVYAIYADLIAGSPEPVPFLRHPLAWNGTTAVQLDPAEGHLVESFQREAAPMTDLLLVIPARMKEQWSAEIYGIPRLADGIIRVSWNSAAESLPTAICTGQLFLHPETGQILNPMAAVFSPEEEQRFFAEPVLPSRLERYRERLVELSGTPADVLERNHGQVQRVLGAYVANRK
jgi:hypothetical protein